MTRLTTIPALFGILVGGVVAGLLPAGCGSNKAAVSKQNMDAQAPASDAAVGQDASSTGGAGATGSGGGLDAGYPTDGAGTTELPADTAADLPLDGRADSLGPSDANGDTSYADVCQAVANSTYVSLEQHECGRAPTGVASCQWGITFSGSGSTGQLKWHHSDYIEWLNYQCTGFAITAVSSLGTGPVYKGLYDPATGILTWDGFGYTKSTP